MHSCLVLEGNLQTQEQGDGGWVWRGVHCNGSICRPHPLTDAACIAAAQHRMQGGPAGAEEGEPVLLEGRSALQQQYT